MQFEELKKSRVSPEDVLRGALGSVNVGSSGWASALCPFHNDSSPSFSIHVSSGNWCCYACSKKGTWADTGFASPVVGVYPYYAGDKLVQVKVREYPKKFYILKPDENGELIRGGYKGPVLYNWNDAKTHDVIYVVEGEKDCDTLSNLMLGAVTAGGASSWLPEYGEMLKGKSLIIIPDNDPAGRGWLERVVGTLQSDYKIGVLPEGIKDITEFLESGKSLAQLTLEDRPIKPLSDIVTLRDVTPPPIRKFLLGGLIPEGAITLLYADGGVGKSLLSLAIAQYLADGREFLGHPMDQKNALIVDWELDADEAARRSRQIARGYSGNIPNGLFYMAACGPLVQYVDKLKALIREESIGLVVLDSIGASCGGDTNSAQAIVEYMACVKSLGCTAILIDHECKPPVKEEAAKRETTKPYGSVYKYNLSRSVLKLVRDGVFGNSSSYTVYQFKNNFGRLTPPFRYKLDYDGKMDCFLWNT